jgi:hypothetical protein
VNKCQQHEWHKWDVNEDPAVTAFLKKAERLFSPMEISLKMYWEPAHQSGGGKQRYRNIPAHYADGSKKPFLMRMEALESELKLSVDDVDHANMELRLKHIVRRFLRRKMQFHILINIKIKHVFGEWASEMYLRTARASTGHYFL